MAPFVGGTSPKLAAIFLHFNLVSVGPVLWALCQPKLIARMGGVRVGSVCAGRTNRELVWPFLDRSVRVLASAGACAGSLFIAEGVSMSALKKAITRIDNLRLSQKLGWEGQTNQTTVGTQQVGCWGCVSGGLNCVTVRLSVRLCTIARFAW